MPSQIIRDSSGQEYEVDEWLPWAVYSTMEFAGRSKLDLRAFTYTQGDQVPVSPTLPQRTATLLDTNQMAKNRTNQDEELLLFGITYEVYGISNASTNPATYPAAGALAARAPGVSRHNLRVLQRDVMIEFLVGAKITKPQMRVPFAYLNQSVGTVAHGTGPLAAGNQLDFGSGGRVSGNNQWRFELPIRIEPDRVMYLRAFSQQAMNDLNQDIGIRWYLDTMRRRPFG